ncbi:MAG TPA: hypothetical protein VGG20_02435, partial [Thermoanaerobaculia bacterium]
MGGASASPGSGYPRIRGWRWRSSPDTGRDAAFRLYKESGPDGFAIETGNGGELVGHSQLFDERLIEALHVVERLVR